VTHPERYDSGTIGAYAKAYEKIARAGPGMVFVSAPSRLAFEGRFGTNFRFLKAISLYVRSGSLAEAMESVLALGEERCKS
jgi:hypothetical protein